MISKILRVINGVVHAVDLNTNVYFEQTINVDYQTEKVACKMQANCNYAFFLDDKVRWIQADCPQVNFDVFEKNPFFCGFSPYNTIM